MVRNPQAKRVQRLVSTSHASPTRPVMRPAQANAKGTVNPTSPRYRRGGWNATRMWFCRRGSGPGPSVGTGPFTVVNGLDAVSIRPKKKAATA